MSMTEAVRTVIGTAWRWLWIMLAVLTVGGVGLGYLIAQLPGVWGALLGVAGVIIFSGTTVGVMYATARMDPQVTMIVVLGSWAGKMAVLVIMFMILGKHSFYSRPVLAVVILLGAFGSALLDFLALTRSRVPYVSPETTVAPVDEERPAAAGR